MHVDLEHCREPGCAQPRVRFSVFCEQHHQEQLRRSGLLRPLPRDPSDPVRGTCRRQLKAWELKAITNEELLATLYDRFVIAHINGEDWDAGLDSLPAVIATDLLGYVKAHEPRVMNPRPTDPQRRAVQDRDAIIAQAKLVARLEDKSR